MEPVSRPEPAPPEPAPPEPARREVEGVLLRVAYDGRGFSGFAPQPTQRTVAGELLGAIAAVDPSVKQIRGSSRTDAGVHARDQCVAFDPQRKMPPRAWQHWINRELPSEIAIRSAVEVRRGFEPRFHALEKTYRYVLLLDESRDPLLDARAWRLHDLRADEDVLARMRAELDALRGEHDFAAFRSASDPRTDTVRTIVGASISRGVDDPRLVTVQVSGSGFMHNMVRIIVGATVDVGRGRLEPGAVARGIATRERASLGITAPPDGLYLYETRLDLTSPSKPAQNERDP